MSAKIAIGPGKSARNRTLSTQHLHNKDFSYLFNNDDLSPASPSFTDASGSLTPLPQNNSFSNGSNNGKNKRKSAKPRTSSIQINTTKSADQQLLAIKKEIEYLTKEVPHFSDLYKLSLQTWSLSKRNKTEIETFALIQSLTSWIQEYGSSAVKQYDDFKQSAETEILNMVKKIEKLTNQNEKFKLLIENAEIEKNYIKQKYDKQSILIIKQSKEIEDNKVINSTNATNENILNDLNNQILAQQNDNKTLSEKYDRVEKYWKMTQSENDDLRNKNYALEDEIAALRAQLKQQTTNAQQMKFKHQNTLHDLQKEHANYAKQMQQEQEQLIQASNNANQSAANMTPTAVGFTIDAMDDDIQASGVTDDIDDDDDAGGMFSLANDMNVYEYEDDAWLDETDSDYSDDIIDDQGSPTPPTPAVVVKPATPPPPAPVNKQLDFQMEKQSHYKDIEYKDHSQQFSSSKMSFGQDAVDKTNAFQMTSQKISVQHDKKSPVVKDATPPASLQFSSEKISIQVENKTRRKSLNLSMSSTKIAQTPNIKSPFCSTYEMASVSGGVDVKAKDNDFASVSGNIIGQKNDMIHKKDIPKPVVAAPPKVPKIKVINQFPAAKKEKYNWGGKNFADRLKLFRHLETTKGGKPQVLEHAHKLKFIRNWNSKNQNQNTNNNTINKSMNNVYVTKATVHQVGDSKNRGHAINLIKITKSTNHTLKPRIFGYMKIIKSKFIPKWQCSQKPRFFFCLDGLPSETNVNKKEPDFAKNRKHDYLVPTLFFFQDKDDYDEFAKEVKNIAVRAIKFQKLFAQYARGVWALNKYAMGDGINMCTTRLNQLKNTQNSVINKNEINSLKTVLTDTSLLLCNENEIHRFLCSDKQQRNRWIKKVNKLVDKRRQRIQKINTQTINTTVLSSVTSDVDAGNTSGVDTPVSVIGSPTAAIGSPAVKPVSAYQSNIITRNSRASMYKLSKIKAIEQDFD